VSGYDLSPLVHALYSLTQMYEVEVRHLAKFFQIQTTLRHKSRQAKITGKGTNPDSMK